MKRWTIIFITLALFLQTNPTILETANNNIDYSILEKPDPTY